MLECPQPSIVVCTALWALSSLIACNSDDSDSTTNADESTSTSTTDADEAGETLVEGCWDREGGGYYSDPIEFESFVCPTLPIPCAPVELAVVHCFDCETEFELDTESMTPEDIAEADANARCVAAGLRDATPATYRVAVSEEQGFSGYAVTYTVLTDGAVATLDSYLDLDIGRYEAYRQLHPPAYYDACANAADVLGVMACLAGSSEGTSVAGIDDDACIDGEPSCGD